MLWRDLRILQVYGSNTNVGKTVVSTILCKALRRRDPNSPLLYLKPVSTGPIEDADDRYDIETSSMIFWATSEYPALADTLPNMPLA